MGADGGAQCPGWDWRTRISSSLPGRSGCGEHAADDSPQERHHRHRYRSLQGRRARRGRQDHDDRHGADDAGRPGDRRRRQIPVPRRHRRAHAPRHAVRRHHVSRRLRVGNDRGGARRHDDHRRLRHPVQGPDAAPRLGNVDEEGRGQGGDRLRLPHDHDRPVRPGGAGDGRARPPGRDLVQAVHGVSRRVHAGRRAASSGRCCGRARTAARSACTPRTAASSTCW